MKTKSIAEEGAKAARLVSVDTSETARLADVLDGFPAIEDSDSKAAHRMVGAMSMLAFRLRSGDLVVVKPQPAALDAKGAADA